MFFVRSRGVGSGVAVGPGVGVAVGSGVGEGTAVAVGAVSAAALAPATTATTGPDARALSPAAGPQPAMLSSMLARINIDSRRDALRRR
jgi:hypothetical protein